MTHKQNQSSSFKKKAAGRAVQRGGNWGNGANAGVFCANLNNAPSNVNNNIGFRCCAGPRQMSCPQRGQDQSGGAVATTISSYGLKTGGAGTIAVSYNLLR